MTTNRRQETRPTLPRRDLFRRICTSLAGLVGIAAAVVGIPAVLYAAAGNPLPARFSVQAVIDALRRPDDGTLFIHIVAWVGWIAWVVFLVAITAELIGQLSGRRIRIPGFRVPQMAAAPLVAMLLAVFLAAPLILNPAQASAAPTTPTPAPTTQTSHTAPGTPAAQATHGPASPHEAGDRAGSPTAVVGGDAADRSSGSDLRTKLTPASSQSPRTQDVSYRVQPDDSLWAIAEQHYGDGHAWTKIARANHHLVGERGENYLEAGWKLTLPDVPTHVVEQSRENGAGPGGSDVDSRTAEPGHSYRVEKGDSLSAIADEAYDDATQWPQIYDANQGQLSDPDLILTGQTLTIPADEAESNGSNDSNDSPKKRRQPGTDNERGDTQQQDRRAEPPTPPTTQAPPPAQPSAQPSAPAPSQTTAPTHTMAPSTGPSSQASQASQSNPPAPRSGPAAQTNPDRGQDEDGREGRRGQSDRQGSSSDAPMTIASDQLAPVLVAGPASALLAAGILGLIAGRRRTRAISRRPGRRVPALSEEAQQAVTAMRQIAAPLTVAHLDRALRTLAAGLAQQHRNLPAITAIRLDDDRLDCRLATAETDPPAKPFTANPDGTIWTLTADRADTLLDATQANQVAAPYPSLVTLGQDADGAHLLVDLETIACLQLSTPDDGDTQAVLAALAFELATSSWADDLTLTIVGCCPELPVALGVDRARHLDHFDQLIRSLESDAAHSRQLMLDEGLSGARHGRAGRDGADSWTPHIVLIGHQLSGEESRRLAAVLTELPRVAVAAVTSGGATESLDGWELVTRSGTDEAVLHPLDLTLTPQRLSGDTYRAVCDALTQSQRTDTEPAPWWNHNVDPRVSDATGQPDGDTETPRPTAPTTDTADGLAAAPATAAAPDQVGTAAPPQTHVVVSLPTSADGGALSAAAAADLPRQDLPDDPAHQDETNDPAHQDQTDEAPAEDSQPQSENCLGQPSDEVDRMVDDGQADSQQADSSRTASIEVREPEPDVQSFGASSADGSGTVLQKGDAIGDADNQIVADQAGGATAGGSGQLVGLRRPTLLLLGDVELVNVEGQIAKSRNPAELFEPIAYVHLHPGTLTTALHTAMADRMSKSNVDALVSRARRYLGEAPGGGKLFPDASRRGGLRFYQLHEFFTSDWCQFTRLIDGGVNAAPTSRLTEALGLVRGRPIASIADGLWRWSEDWREEATATIVDTAHEVAERAISRSDLTAARWAVKQGRRVDKITETLARDALRIERLAGNHAMVQRIAETIISVARRNGVQPDAETAELLHEIRDGQRRRAQ